MNNPLPTIREQVEAGYPAAFQIEFAVLMSIVLAGALAVFGLSL